MTGPHAARLKALRLAMEGRFDCWQWSAGLTPEAVEPVLGGRISPEPGRLVGRDLLHAVITVPQQPHAVQFRWEADGELALVELSDPSAVPSWPAVIEALGSPDVIYPHGQGPWPGSEQRCHFDRGLTIFDGAGLGYQAVWLYPPTSPTDYGALTGAFETPTRAR
ncbi:hypothetical protein MWU75_06060 [Ornithinimicrobium sp. F0845]|uniref:hypothetical protein n=1 Tax=Ornithinimicrobium sp. F0845 TaxID=2926412 RepID=UPI001FF612FF|nr:hypothetical protein [Ornithinimicrobium sp. F0845]MCK0111699.1 hypothetical protein [Ornithinimicrobium sp. F0845]